MSKVSTIRAAVATLSDLARSYDADGNGLLEHADSANNATLRALHEDLAARGTLGLDLMLYAIEGAGEEAIAADADANQVVTGAEAALLPPRAMTLFAYAAGMRPTSHRFTDSERASAIGNNALAKTATLTTVTLAPGGTHEERTHEAVRRACRAASMSDVVPMNLEVVDDLPTVRNWLGQHGPALGEASTEVIRIVDYLRTAGGGKEEASMVAYAGARPGVALVTSHDNSFTVVCFDNAP